MRISIILPAKNEAAGLGKILPRLRQLYPDAEIIVVDDGSTDDPAELARRLTCKVVQHPYSKGNGAAIKSGARAAQGDVLVFMDADGQHQPEDIPRLLAHLQRGYDMVVGARGGSGQANRHRAVANALYNHLASWVVEHEIPDLTSGFRAVDAVKFKRFLSLLPNGFSYPTTITMSFFRAGYSVDYLPIEAARRSGRSHIRVLRDGFKFFMIIFKIATLYSPLKLFLPISFSFFMTGVAYYTYTFLSFHRLTIMSALLFITAVLVFLMGLISEQITALYFKNSED